jgi:hypothetical protein
MSRGRVLHAYSFFLYMTYSVKTYNEWVIANVKTYNEWVVMNDKLIKSGLLSMSSVMYSTQELSI